MSFVNAEGKAVPQVDFPVRVGDAWEKWDSEQLFKGKTVVVFGLPGAFTPTCSSTHLPRYNELAGEFNKRGVDAIYCLSVNDTFVMNAWAAQQEAENIIMLPDGNGDFSAGIGMLVEKNDLGFGKRSWRYSMLVRDGVIEKMFIEPNKAGDPFEVSDADTMLQYLDADFVAPPSVALFSKPGCPFCAKAKAALSAKGWAYEEIVLGRDATITSLRAVSGRETVPQVFINGEHIGGSDDLAAWLAQ